LSLLAADVAALSGILNLCLTDAANALKFQFESQLIARAVTKSWQRCSAWKQGGSAEAVFELVKY